MPDEEHPYPGDPVGNEKMSTIAICMLIRNMINSGVHNKGIYVDLLHRAYGEMSRLISHKVRELGRLHHLRIPPVEAGYSREINDFLDDLRLRGDYYTPHYLGSHMVVEFQDNRKTKFLCKKAIVCSKELGVEAHNILVDVAQKAMKHYENLVRRELGCDFT